MTRFHRAMREALVLTLVGSTLGFTTTLIRGEGVFAPDSASSQHSVDRIAAPVMISLPEARTLFESDGAVFIDARHRFEYVRGHIPGAMNLPINEFDRRAGLVDSLPRDKIIVTYCDGIECNSSISLAAKLYEAGFSGVRIFFAGWNEWKDKNLPTEETLP